jgi:hypothetical protein
VWRATLYTRARPRAQPSDSGLPEVRGSKVVISWKPKIDVSLLQYVEQNHTDRACTAHISTKSTVYLIRIPVSVSIWRVYYFVVFLLPLQKTVWSSKAVQKHPSPPSYTLLQFRSTQICLTFKRRQLGFSDTKTANVSIKRESCGCPKVKLSITKQKELKYSSFKYIFIFNSCHSTLCEWPFTLSTMNVAVRIKDHSKKVPSFPVSVTSMHPAPAIQYNCIWFPELRSYLYNQEVVGCGSCFKALHQ